MSSDQPAGDDRRWTLEGFPAGGFRVDGADFDTGVITSKSDDYILIEDRLVPEWVEFEFSQEFGNPTLSGRVELRGDVPQCVALAFTSAENGREIRQSDLRSIEVNRLVIDLIAGLSLGVDRTDPNRIVLNLAIPKAGDFPTPLARNFIDRQRHGPGLRDITPELLQRVAEVYRANIDHAPTLAVAKTFGVKSRMASTYVQRARAAGYLPPTRQGKKRA